MKLRIHHFLLSLLFALSPLWALSAMKPATGEITVPSKSYGGISMIDATALRLLPQASAFWHPLSEAFLLRIEGDPAVELRFHTGLPFATVKGESVELPLEPFREPDHFWVPRIAVLAALDSLLPGELQWNEATSTLSWSPERDFLGMEIKPFENGTIVELKFTRKVNYEKFFTRPMFLLRLNDVFLSSDSLNRKFTTGQIRTIQAIQDPQTAQITFEVNHLVGDIEVIERDEGRTLGVLFRRPIEKPKSSASSTIKKESTVKKPRSIKTVVIDPGHGGKDPGAKGKFAEEKTITLAVGKKLAAELKKRGYTPRLTRNDDRFVTLKERPELASKWGGDLFLSLHCDAVPGDEKKKAQTRGFKAFILREAESEEDKALARRENKFIDESSSAVSRQELSPVEWILLEHQLNLYTKESEEFAFALVNSLENVKGISKSGNGAGQAGFYVLVGAFMPAVLLELGFISNPDEEKYLASEAGQNELVQKIADSIDRYSKGE